MLTETAFVVIDTKMLGLLLGIGALCLACFQWIMVPQLEERAGQAMKIAALSAAALGMGNLLSFFRELVPTLLVRNASHLLILVGFIAFYRAVTLLGKKPFPGAYCLAVFLIEVCAFNWFWLVVPDLAARLIVLNVCWIAILFPLCLALFSAKEVRTYWAWWTAGVAVACMLLALIDRASHLAINYGVYQAVADGTLLPYFYVKASQFAMLIAGAAFVVMADGETSAAWSRLAMQDPLTQLLNRRGFFEKMRSDRQAAVSQTGTALLLLDLDYFKAINDLHGHAVGDAVLQKVAQALACELRSADSIGRYGGEEFIVLLPGVTTEHAVCVAERLRRAVEKLTVGAGNATITLTASIGLAVDQRDYRDVESLLGYADGALYEAKLKGRNRVVLAREPEPILVGASPLAAESRA